MSFLLFVGIIFCFILVICSIIGFLFTHWFIILLLVVAFAIGGIFQIISSILNLFM